MLLGVVFFDYFDAALGVGFLSLLEVVEDFGDTFDFVIEIDNFLFLGAFFEEGLYDEAFLVLYFIGA